MARTIEIQNLSVSYDKQIVLDGLSLVIPSGKLTAVLGENGCGKSTLLHAISRLLPYSSGSIRIAGKPLEDYSARDLALHLSLVSQNTDPLPISVYDYLMLGRTPHRSLFSLQNSDKDRQIVNDIIKKLNLTQFQDKPLAELSGGERQLSAIARSIIQDTPIMLLDEPTANLDIRHQEEIMKILQREVSDKEKTVAVVMHDVNLASRYAQHIVLIKNHNVMAHGTPEEVLNIRNLSSLYQSDLTEIKVSERSFFVPR